MLSRRQFSALLGAGCFAPKVVRADDAERQFLFVFANGGWDPTMVFAPLFDNSNVDMETDATTAEAGGIRFVDSGSRPEVRSFFEQWGSQSLVINGLDLQTVAHDRGKRILMTGGVSNVDDVGSILAANSSISRLMPYLVVSGPAFSSQYPGHIVRLGKNAQLRNLVDATDLTDADIRVHTEIEGVTSAYLSRRLGAWSSGVSGNAMNERMIENLQHTQNQLEELRTGQSQLDLSTKKSDNYGYACDMNFMGNMGPTLESLALGHSRCAIIQDDGWCEMRWDSHSSVNEQSQHYDRLFAGLNDLMVALDDLALLSQVTVVVCSELGRHPQLNSLGGKHHWPVTSVMLLGSGISGGRVIGGFDDDVMGQPISLETGEASNNGVALTSGNLAATLFALGDVDPGDHVDEEPILGALV